jgi:predicted nucleic acid-binding protein
VIELADTSAWTTRHRAEAVAVDFDQRLRRGEIATCRMVVLELLQTTRDATELSERRAQLDELRDAPIKRRQWDRAVDVMQALAGRGMHRALRLQELLIAAAAEAAEVPVLHYDRQFELIAEVTGQEVRPLAPLGSL